MDSQEPTEEQANSKDARHSKDVYIAMGSYTDCENLLEKYLSMRTSTFEDFVTLWKEMKFSEIYCGRDTFGELLEFTEELFVISKSFILPPHSQIKRIGALYLMYGLYTQQPTQGAVKYRITPQEWSIILKFVENLKTHGFIDANYIFHKMCLDGAFLTVSQTREYGLERNMRKYLMPWPARDQETQSSSVFALETVLSRACRTSVKAQANACRSKYSEIKESLSGSSFHPMDGLDVDIDSILQANIDNSSLDSSLVSDIGLKRGTIKKRALKVKGSAKNTESEKANSASPLPSTSREMVDTSMPDSDEIESLDEETDDRYLLPRQRKIRDKRKRKKALSSIIGTARTVRDEVTPNIGGESFTSEDLM